MTGGSLDSELARLCAACLSDNRRRSSGREMWR